jgi:predicted nucleic acid-binding protein
LLEGYTLVLFRLGHNAAAHWLDDLAKTPLINPGPDDYRHAVTRLRALNDQPITLFDAVVASLAMRLGLPVWTYDHHFDLMRTAVWR